MPRPLGRWLNRVVAPFGAALIIATGVLLGGCDGQGGDRAAAPPPAKRVDRVEIKDFNYVPAATTVPAGTTITFTNRDKAPHTATSGTSPASDGVFDSGTLRQGDSKRVKLARAGTFAYYCALHPFMKATVIVR
jgi:plastocyanin